jgi:hypothetical protein
MCSGFVAGSCLRLIDFFASLNSRLAGNKEEEGRENQMVGEDRCMWGRTSWLEKTTPLAGQLRKLSDVHRVPSSLLGPVYPSFRALSGRLKFTV